MGPGVWQEFANITGGGCPGPAGTNWHLEEVVLKIAGKKHYLLGALGAEHGVVLDVLVQSRRDKKAAKRLLRKLLKRQCPGAWAHDHGQAGFIWRSEEGDHARRRAPPAQGAQQPGGKLARQPTRRRERQMKRFKSARQAQRFLSAHDQINNLFLLPRHRMTATNRAERAHAFDAWHDVCGIKLAA